nr:peptidylprolyl isomerase [Lysobacter gilvus]
MQRLLREPLLHFLVLGALLFAVYGWMQRDALQAPDEVVVDQARVDALSARFHRLWQREPSPDELRGIVDAWVREEILYREGVAVGMERDDDVVRRRVVQKLTYLNEGMAVEVPTQAELQAWLHAHPDDYRLAPRYAFRQVYFDPTQHGDALARDIAQAQASLQRDANANVGDVAMLPQTMRDAAADEVSRTFGAQFAQSLPAIPDGRWSDPIASDYGVHLVWIDARTPARMPALAQVRRDVERDLLADRTKKANEAFYDTLRKRYTVKVDADLGGTAESHAVAVGAR